MYQHGCGVFSMPDFEIENKSASVQIDAREKIGITDVLSVISFDDEQILLETGNGKLCIEGEGLHVTVLSLENGIVRAEGKINGLYYQTLENTRRGRLFPKRG